MRAAERLLQLLGGVALLLGGAGAGPSSWHTLHYFKTVIWEPGWQIPQLTSLAFVDGQLISRYDTNTHQCVPQSSRKEGISHEYADFWARSINWDFGSSVVADLMILKNLYNQSREIHTLQVFSGCELSGDNHTRGFVKYGYNGRDFLSLHLATLTWTAMDAEAKPMKRKWEAERDRGKLWEHFLTEICVEDLHTHLHYGKETVLKADTPMVRVTRQAGSDGLETLFCQLYGFYPKEIEVTWMRDKEDQKPDTFTGGVVPNSDGTYNTWLSIEVEPNKRGHYQCHVEHDSLLDPLDLGWEDPASVSKVGLIVGVVVGVIAVLVLVGLIFHIKKQQNSSYQGAPTSDRGLDSSVRA